MNTAQIFRRLPVLFLAALMGCASGQRVPDAHGNQGPSGALEKPWEHAMETCHVDPDAVTVVCPAEDFRLVLKSCVNISETLNKTNVRLDEAIKLGLVDKQELEARAYDLQRKLDSPWRSWWLWGLIGTAAGVALGVGLVVAIQ